ncbi:MAG TPA: DUF3108 domain-containing protein [Bdellovibrionales bacterium]|nr:DUF3108 domain-containing protein [Bdellovibrionales bacterium]
MTLFNFARLPASLRFSFRKIALIFLVLMSAAGCASKILKVEDSEKVLKNEEYEEEIKVKDIPIEAPQTEQSGTFVRLPGPDPVPGAFPEIEAAIAAKAAAEAAKMTKGSAAKKAAAEKAAAAKAAKTNPPATSTPAPVVPGQRQPPFEDSTGFTGRRPNVDPFRVGEKVTLDVSYFNVSAGEMTLETRGFASVNGNPSYRFAGTARSTSVFAMFYAVDDWFETFVDYKTLVPYSYSLHVKESKQLRETRTVFEWNKKRAKYWDRKINEEKKLEKQNYTWKIPDYTQNIFSAVFYLRTFQLEPGKKYKYHVSHEKENFVVTAEVLRREKIKTPAGEFNTIVLKPHVELDGIFRPVGDIFFWMTDDDRRFLVRIESKIKIGKIVAVAKKIEQGRQISEQDVPATATPAN